MIIGSLNKDPPSNQNFFSSIPRESDDALPGVGGNDVGKNKVIFKGIGITFMHYIILSFFFRNIFTLLNILKVFKHLHTSVK